MTDCKEEIKRLSKEISKKLALLRKKGQDTHTFDLFLVDAMLAYSDFENDEKATDLLHKARQINKDLSSF